MLATHVQSRRDNLGASATQLASNPARRLPAVLHPWVRSTLAASLLGAGAAACALFVLAHLVAGSGIVTGVAVLGAVISGVALGVIHARRLPGEPGAPLTWAIAAVAVTGAAGAAGAIAWLRALRLGAGAAPGWDAGLGAVYMGIVVSGALVFAAGAWLLLRESDIELAGWGAEGELVWAGELLAWSGPAAAVLAFLLACGFGLSPPLLLAAGAGLPLGALLGFGLARLAAR